LPRIESGNSIERGQALNSTVDRSAKGTGIRFGAYVAIALNFALTEVLFGAEIAAVDRSGGAPATFAFSGPILGIPLASCHRH
jgi:hypothetical protein